MSGPLVSAEGRFRSDIDAKLSLQRLLVKESQGQRHRLSAARELPPTKLAERLTEQLLERAPDNDVAFLLYRCG
jgi:hypothetical protein